MAKGTGTAPPEWAADLIETVCTDAGRRPPKATWYRRDEWFSSGTTYCYERRIHVTAGTSVIDARLVLLHELAHFLGRPKWHHTRRFWDLAWSLYQRYADADIDWIIYREQLNHAKSLTYCPLV